MHVVPENAHGSEGESEEFGEKEQGRGREQDEERRYLMAKRTPYDEQD